MFMMPYVTRLIRGYIPFAIALIVAVCCFNFFVLQANDAQRYQWAYDYYASGVLAPVEAEAFKAHLREQRNGTALRDFEALEAQNAIPLMLQQMEADPQFSARIDQGTLLTTNDPQYHDWRSARAQFEQLESRIVTERFAFDTAAPDWAGAITHQFLHGGTGHLVGNMVVLLLVGPVVEALIGFIPFVCLFLIGGIAAAGAQWLVTQGAPGGLIGASGAISAVMAAFAVLLGTRRIPFFYFLVVYFDVIKAPALIALPVWLVNEAVQFYWFGDASRIAYGAHFGGLLAGALLVLPLRPRAIRKLAAASESQEADDPHAPVSSSAARHLERARRLMARQQFDEARAVYAQAAQDAHGDIDTLRECFNVARLSPASRDYHRIVMRILALKSRQQEVQHLVLDTFSHYLAEAQPRPLLSPALATVLIERFAETGCLPQLERTIRVLHASAPAHEQLAPLIRRAIAAMNTAGEPQRAQALKTLLDRKALA